jgi:hypothetical protein
LEDGLLDVAWFLRYTALCALHSIRREIQKCHLNITKATARLSAPVFDNQTGCRHQWKFLRAVELAPFILASFHFGSPC